MRLWNKGIKHIAGIDEVGRGALAGPLVVGAVILDRNHLENETFLNDETLNLYTQIKDSKLIAPKKRARLSEFIKEHAISYALEQISPKVIDEVGIMGATQLAFFNVTQKLKTKAHYVLTDAFEIKKLTKFDQTNIIRGDNLSISIAAASIIAKVFRDNLMVDLHNDVGDYQKYQFHRHKGYGTKLHREMIELHGPCDIHRRCFEPVKSMFNL